MLVVGTVGAELFLQRSWFVLVVIAGLVWLLLGWPWLKALAFPIAFLLFMVPLPAIVMNAIASVQLFAAQTATSAWRQWDLLREGNVISLADTTLEVAEACGGIRSLQALLALGAVYGYFTQRAVWKRWALLLLSIPIAIAANTLRGKRTRGSSPTTSAARWRRASTRSRAGSSSWPRSPCSSVARSAPDALPGRQGRGWDFRGAAQGRGVPWPVAVALTLMCTGLLLWPQEAVIARRPFSAGAAAAARAGRAADLAMDERVLDLLKLTDYTTRAYMPPAAGGAGPDRACEGHWPARPRRYLYVGYYASAAVPLDVPLAEELPPRLRLDLKSSARERGNPRSAAGHGQPRRDREGIRQAAHPVLVPGPRARRGEYDAKASCLGRDDEEPHGRGAAFASRRRCVGSEEDAYPHALAPPGRTGRHYASALQG